jgi:hypothetical protein
VGQMSQTGQVLRRPRRRLTVRCSTDSGHIDAPQRTGALGQFQTHALQQIEEIQQEGTNDAEGWRSLLINLKPSGHADGQRKIEPYLGVRVL